MKIAVLGWGSLIWNPQILMANKEWNQDGPLLPIEFARISSDGRLTLVIKNGSNTVQVLRTLMNTDNLNIAIANLQEREGIHSIEKIGFINLVDNTGSSRNNEISKIISKWAGEKKLDAVIWTDLGVKFKDILNIDFNQGNVLNYLKNLPNEKALLAKEYITNTPKQIRTKFREIIEKELNWK